MSNSYVCLFFSFQVVVNIYSYAMAVFSDVDGNKVCI